MRFDEIPPDLLDYFEPVPDRAPMSDVWKLAPEPLKENHYASFPTEVARRAILAGTSAYGCCAECGSPYRRVTERQTAPPPYRPTNRPETQHAYHGESSTRTLAQVSHVTTLDWQPTCACACPDVVPATVLDPFAGSGTTLLVAHQLGRHGLGIELRESYCLMAERRLAADAPLVDAIAAAAAPQQAALWEAL